MQRQVELHLRQQLVVSVLQGALAPPGASFDDAWVAVWRRAGGAAHRIALCYGRKLFSCRGSRFFLSCCGPEMRLLIACELWHACRSGHLRWESCACLARCSEARERQTMAAHQHEGVTPLRPQGGTSETNHDNFVMTYPRIHAELAGKDTELARKDPELASKATMVFSDHSCRNCMIKDLRRVVGCACF